MNPPCEICQHWAPPGEKLVAGKMIPTNHHPSCPHHYDSLIDVWTVTNGSSYFVTENEAWARAEMKGVEDAVITKEKMHREVFENLPEV